MCEIFKRACVAYAGHSALHGGSTVHILISPPIVHASAPCFWGCLSLETMPFVQCHLQPRETHLSFVFIRSNGGCSACFTEAISLPWAHFSHPLHIHPSQMSKHRLSRDPLWTCEISVLVVDILNLMIDSLRDHFTWIQGEESLSQGTRHFVQVQHSSTLWHLPSKSFSCNRGNGNVL